MRTSIIVLASLALVPSTAFAEGVATGPDFTAPQPATYSPPSETRGGYVAPRSVLYEGGEIPANAHLETKPDVAYVATGASIFGGAYVTSLIYGLATCGAQTKCRAGSAWLYMPLVGPFITAAQSPTTGGQALAAFDGGVQVLGGVLAIVGFAVPRKYVTWQTKSATFTVTPTSGAMPSPPSSIVAESKPDMGAGLSITLSHL